MRFVCISEQTAALVPLNIRGVAFLADVQIVYCAVRHAALNKLLLFVCKELAREAMYM